MLRNKKNIYIGIYSSARETVARAEDENNELIGIAFFPEPINIHISTKQSWEIVKSIALMSLQESGIDASDPNIEIHLGLGIKNTELVEACNKLISKNDFCHKITIISDSHALLLGAHGGKGAIIVLDDGVVGNMLKPDQLVKIGGWGFPHADSGSVPWVGLEAIRLTIQWLDGFIEASPLLVEIYRCFNNDISRLVKWAMYSRTDPQEYNVMCNTTLNYLQENDKYALLLMKQVGLEAVKVYEKLLERSGESSLSCSVHGLLAPYAKKFFNKKMLGNLVEPSGDGTHGAIFAVKNNVVHCRSYSINEFYSPYQINNKYSFTG